MSELVADCPRCGASQITFDLTQEHLVSVNYGWQKCFEAFCICRRCRRSTVFRLCQHTDAERETVQKHGMLKLTTAVNRYMRIEGFVNISNIASAEPPEHTPQTIANAFEEGAKSLAVGAYNAAATMFRLCLDLATRPLLPQEHVPGLKRRTRRDLAPRLEWLFETNRLPTALRELSSCVREDGNDGAHAGTLQEADAEDLLEFTTRLLERLFTEPEKLRLATIRRAERRREPPAS